MDKEVGLMSRLRFLVVLAALLCALPGLASAQSSGNYLGVGAGVNLTRDSDISGSGVNTSADFDNGWASAIAIGHAYGNGVRTEIELNHRENDLDSLTGVTNARGEASSWGLMGNVLYDFANSSPLIPYVGGGIGVARVDVDGAAPISNSQIDESDTVFAYQAIAGISYKLNDDLHLFGDYRYFGTTESDLRLASGTNVDADYNNHTVMIGLRWSFGGPPARKAPMEAAMPAAPAPSPAPTPRPAAQPPAPMPAPQTAPEVARNYIVFFDWDKANLTPEALAIVRDAAANAKTAKVVRIRLTGHADRSGSDRYNMALSLRRANAVKAELARRGVAGNQVAVLGKGETAPLVPTADGVREPQNRRVEIVFE